MHDYLFEDENVLDYDVLLNPVESNEVWTDSIHITNTASVDGTVFVPAAVGQAARQLCLHLSATRHLWQWSACFDHDDAFEAAYYVGSYHLTVYGRAASMYICVDGITEIADLVREWASEVAAGLKGHLVLQAEITAGTYLPAFSRTVDERQDRALRTLFGHAALRSYKMWLGLMVADKRNLPVFLLGEYGLIDGREVKTAFELLAAGLVPNASSALLQMIGPVKGAKEKAVDIIFDISPTIPTKTIQRRGNVKQGQHSVEESTIQLKRYLVGTEIAGVQGGHGFTYKINTPGRGRRGAMVEKINDWEVFQQMHRRPDSWSSSDSDMYSALQGRTALSYTQYRSVTGTRRQRTEVTDIEVAY